MSSLTMKQLKEAAKEINDVVDPDPSIKTVGIKQAALEEAIAAVASQVIDPDEDELSADTIAVLQALGCNPFASDEAANEDNDVDADDEEDEEADDDSDEEAEEVKAAPANKTKAAAMAKADKAAAKKAAGDEAPAKKREPIPRGTKTEEVRALIAEFAKKGTMTQKEVVEAIVAKGYNKNTANTQLYMSKNPAYNKLDKLVVIGKGDTVTFAK